MCASLLLWSLMRLQSLLLLLLLVFFAVDDSVSVALSDDEDAAEDVVLCRRCDRERDGNRRRGNVVVTVLEDGNTNEPVIVSSVPAAGSAIIRRGRCCWKCNPAAFPLGLVLLQPGNQNNTEDATQNRTIRRRGTIIAVHVLAAVIIVGASIMWCERWWRWWSHGKAVPRLLIVTIGTNRLAGDLSAVDAVIQS